MLLNLETLLLEKGVSKDHIAKMKQEKNQSVMNIVKEYKFSSSNALTEYVPLERVVSLIIRGEKGASWFDHVKYYNDLKNRLTRMNDNFKFFLQADDLLSYYQYFMDGETCDKAIYWADTLEFNHYVDDDIYVCKNGNHRTVLAKVTDVPYIQAKVTKYYKHKGENENYV